VGAEKAFKTTKKLLLRQKTRQRVCGNVLDLEKKACEGEFFVKKVRCNMTASKRAIFSHSPIAKQGQRSNLKHFFQFNHQHITLVIAKNPSKPEAFWISPPLP
jgi:hypothetical protein